MVYIKNGIHFKVHEDLKIYQSKSPEPTFVELINEKQSSYMVGVIYRHSTIDTSQFADNINLMIYWIKYLVKVTKRFTELVILIPIFSKFLQTRKLQISMVKLLVTYYFLS